MRSLILPKLAEWQKVGYDYLANDVGAGKTLVIKAKRQIGKSWLANALLLNYASLGTTSAVVEPTLSQARRMYRQITKALRDVNVIETANAATLEITFVNGAEILFKSAQQGDALRGFTVTGVLIIDEAAFIEDDIVDILFPLVDANNANVVMISTPLFTSGRFYEAYIDDDATPQKLVLDWNNYDTSRFLSATKLEEYRKRVSPNKFKSEYLGQFITENGLLFNNLEACIAEPGESKTLYIGIDFAVGSSSDWTVVSAVNEKGEQVFIERFKETPSQQIEHIADLVNGWGQHWQIGAILAEKNSIGGVYIDLLSKRCRHRITNWVTTNKSKKDLVSALQLALDNKEITLLPNEKQIDELRKYQAEVNMKTNVVSYNASVGNDDCVIALMLAYYAYKKSLGTYKISVI